ncbi:esterase 1 [Cubamyces sp. BRFM 1775]|nr:esterase 1 [Cubamyces sp. BRFM 1775]
MATTNWQCLKHWLGAALASLFFIQLSCVTASENLPVVKLGGTEVIGTSYKYLGAAEQEFFGGIPYAEPPVNDLRFAPPVPKNTLDTPVFDATRYGLPCPQLGLNNGTEDCLKLNILRPARTEAGCDAPMPVLVWLYGGGFKTGAADQLNASTLVMHSVQRGTPIIYVNLNYRVGPFGFPQGAEAMARGALNLGLKDQLAALSWVKQNIAAFGGDPEKVTLYGQSAGSISIADLYLNSGLETLVRGTIMSSGFAGTTSVFNATRRETEWTNFVNATPECAGSAGTNETFPCMRNASLATLLSAYNTSSAESPESFQFVPVIDGPDGLIPDLPSKLMSEGKFSRIPLITGANLDDGTFFTPTIVTTPDQIAQVLALLAFPFASGPPPAPFASAVSAILSLYADDPALGSPYGTGDATFGLSPEYKRLAAIIGDLNFHALRRAWMDAVVSAHAREPGVGHDGGVYGYLFADAQAVAAPQLGVTHATEVPYMYGATFLDGPQPAGALSEAMMDYILGFITSLNPNDGIGSERPYWPQYTPGSKVLMQLAGGNTTVIPDDYRQQQIAFLNSVSGEFGQ